MKFDINGKELRDSIKHIMKIYDSSIVAKNKDSCSLNIAVDKENFIIESDNYGVSVRYSTSGVSLKGNDELEVVVDMDSLANIPFKNKPVTFSVTETGHLSFMQGNYKGTLVAKVSEDFDLDFRYDEDHLIDIPKKLISEGIKGLNFKQSSDMNFLPVRLNVSSENIQMISMDKERTAVYKQNVDLDTNDFSLTLPIGILNYLINNIAQSSISVYISESSIYFFIDNGVSWWEVSVPVIDVDSDVSRHMDILDDMITEVENQTFDFKFLADSSSVKEALVDVLVLGEDNKSDVLLEARKESVLFSLKSFKGSASMEIDVDNIEIKNKSSVLFVSKFLKDFVNIYPGDSVEVIVIGDDIEDGYSSIALMKGADYPFIYVFPIGM